MKEKLDDLDFFDISDEDSDSEDGVYILKEDARQLREFQWNLSGYHKKYSFGIYEKVNGEVTLWETQHLFELEPAPEKPENLTDYILQALEQKDLKYVSFFLHHYEKAINSMIWKYLVSYGSKVYDPVTQMNLKLACQEVILKKLLTFDPNAGKEFPKYISCFLIDAILKQIMIEEQWSFSSLSEYKRVRRIGAIYKSCHESIPETIEKFCKKDGCTPRTAREYLAIAIGHRARFLPITEDSENTDDESVEYEIPGLSLEEYLHIRSDRQKKEKLSEMIRTAFAELSPKEQFLLEKHLGISIKDDWVGEIKDRWTFDELADALEYGTAKGTERAYKNACAHFQNMLIGKNVG